MALTAVDLWLRKSRSDGLTVWFTGTMLSAAGWPRKKGLFRSQHVLSTVVDGVVRQLWDLGLCVGASRPELATSLLFDSLASTPKQLEEVGADELESVLDAAYAAGAFTIS